MGIQIAVIIGSLRRDSYNRRLAHAVQRLAPKEFSFKELQIADLPPYNQDEETKPFETVARLKADIRASQGLMFATPEYNRSMPGVLKNAIDHASRPYGQNAWAGKPAGIFGASIGAIGTAVAQQHLRGTLAYLDVPTLGQPEVFLHVDDEFFDANGDIANADTKKFLQGWMDAYVDWVGRFAR
ncbi:MAG TPA: NAD(P)H-dependent oxidoreductase [Steroidobacteraceae bacterium]